MSDNIQIKDAAGVTNTVRTTDLGSNLHIPHHMPAEPTTHFRNSTATTNATSVKASAGSVFGVNVSNTGASARFLKLYNKASAPTVGTDVPVLTIPIAASAVGSVTLGSLGLRFTTGIAFAITGAAADTDTTAIGASEVKVALAYV